MNNPLPEVLCFAGPNGSGKSSFTRGFGMKGEYINADEVKVALGCNDLEAAQIAEKRRIECVKEKRDFTFETVLSTGRNLKLLKQAKESGFFVRMIYVLTETPRINVLRIKARVMNGGHDVPEEKTVSRYEKTIALFPQSVAACDICHVYDNSEWWPVRIFKKRKEEYFFQETQFWSKQKIAQLTGVSEEKLLPMAQMHPQKSF